MEMGVSLASKGNENSKNLRIRFYGQFLLAPYFPTSINFRISNNVPL